MVGAIIHWFAKVDTLDEPYQICPANFYDDV